MDQFQFDYNITGKAADLVGELYSYPDLTRTRVEKIVDLFGNFANQSAISALFNSVLKRLKDLGENSDNVASFASMFQTLQFPFNKFDTEWKCFEYFKQKGWYIPPEEIEIESIYKNTIDETVSKPGDGKINVQFVPVRQVLKQIIELPGIFKQIMSYVHGVEKEEHAIYNVMQTKYWQDKKSRLNCNEILLPLALYDDDVETNNALGSHRGRGKIGAVYIVLPFLPPHLFSKTENILLILLYNSYRQKKVPFVQVFGKVTEELLFLEAKGIFVETDDGIVNLRFSLVAMVADNLAMNSIMGFTMSFSANYSCRFCLTSNANFESILKSADCKMRTESSYNDDLKKRNSKETGIANMSAIPDIASSTTLELLSVDLWHDLLEGVCQYDLGSVLKEFLKFPTFTLDVLNKRLEEFTYSEDDIQNKPLKITDTQLRDKVIKMSASEMLCMFRNMGLLFGHLVPFGNKHWKLLNLINEIIYLVMTPVVYDWFPDYLASRISEYLSLRRDLFPNTCKPKHHLLVHYPQIMEKLGPLRLFGTIRCESKNRDIKMPSKNSQNRVNNEKNLAIKNQLALSHRLQTKRGVDSTSWKVEASREMFAWQLPDFPQYSTLFPNCDPNTRLEVVEKMTFNNCTLKKEAVIMIPSEDERNLFVIHVIIKDPCEQFHFVTRVVTEFSYYSDHYQVYILPENFRSCKFDWRCLTLSDLDDAWFSFISVNGRNDLCIPKRWI